MAERVRGSVLIKEPGGTEGNWAGHPESALLVFLLPLWQMLGAPSLPSELSAGAHRVPVQ